MLEARDIIRTMLRTEKITQAGAQGKYAFVVDRRANKIQIKQAIEDIFKVQVKKVNTMVVPGKLKRVRHQFGYTPQWKKAVVTLRKGFQIESAA